MASSAPPTAPTVGVLAFEGETHPPGIDRLTELAEVRVASSTEEVEAVVAEADILLVLDFRTDALRHAWARADRLRWIHAASAGVDQLMFPELRQSDVVLTNARGVFDNAIAEWVLGVMLLFCKDLRVTIEAQQQRRWAHRETERLAGRRALLVGLGGIGQAVARLAQAAGVEVTGVARSARDEPALGHVHAFTELNEILPSADFVILAAPLTEQTRNLLGAEQFRRMRPEARLINVGRGELVDEPALVEALRAGALAGAALDVFTQEPLPAEHPLWGFDNVLVSPHMSGDVVGWREELTAQFVENLKRWRAGEPLDNVVDKTVGYPAAAPAPSATNPPHRGSRPR